MNPNIILWCSLCNKRPSDGTLKIMPDGATEPLTLQACEICVMKIPDEGWLTPDNLNKEKVLTMDMFNEASND